MSLVSKTDVKIHPNGKFPNSKPKKRTLSDTISRLRRENEQKSDKKSPESEPRDDVMKGGGGLKLRWYLVNEEGKVVMTADAEAIKQVCDVIMKLLYVLYKI